MALYETDWRLPRWFCLAMAVFLPMGFFRLVAVESSAEPSTRFAGRGVIGWPYAAPSNPCIHRLVGGVLQPSTASV